MKHVPFFTKINYSACNEDSESERKALSLNEKDTVLCITGSGARALDLLIDRPKKVISVDFNQTQNHLLALKIAAYQSLNYPEFCTFLGLNNHKDKLRLYYKVAPQLPPEVKEYWDQQPNLIKRGVLYCGTWEKLLASIAKTTWIRKSTTRKLLHASDLKLQKEIWNNRWNNGVWRLFLKVLSNRFLWTKIIKEPGILLVPKEFDIASYLNSRLTHLANHFPLHSNHFAHLMFYGRYQENCILPMHLREEHFETIKQQLHTIEIISDSLVHLVQDQEFTSKITAFSLSDFSSYADPEMYAGIWNNLAKNSPDGALFCERQFLVKRTPEQFSSSIQRNPELENMLNQQDETAIYTFCAGKIDRSDHKKTTPVPGIS